MKNFFVSISLVLIFFILFGVINQTSLAETTSSVVNNNGKHDSLIDYLIKEKSSMAEESSRQYEMMKSIFQQERDSLENIFDRFIYIFSGLIFTIGAIVSILLWNIRSQQKTIYQNIKEENLKILERQKEELRENLMSRYSNLKSKIEEEINEKQREVKTIIENLDELKDKNILWIYSDENMSDRFVIDSLKRRGLKNIYTRNVNDDLYIDSVFFHAAVFSILENESVQKYFPIIYPKLRKLGDPPLIVYTYANGGKQIRFDDDDWGMMDEYGNHTVANFPGSLQAALNSVLRWI